MSKTEKKASLQPGSLSPEHFELLISGTSIRGKAVIAALRDHLVGGLTQVEAFTKHGVNRSQFSRRLQGVRDMDELAMALSKYYPRQ